MEEDQNEKVSDRGPIFPKNSEFEIEIKCLKLNMSLENKEKHD